MRASEFSFSDMLKLSTVLPSRITVIVSAIARISPSLWEMMIAVTP
jgi:hypothetical protein